MQLIDKVDNVVYALTVTQSHCQGHIGGII